MASPLTPPTEQQSSPLVGIVRVVRERWWIAAAAAAVAVVLAIAYILLAEKRYESTATLLFQPKDVVALFEPAAQSDVDPERQLGTDLLLISSGTVAERVSERLEGDLTPDQVASSIDARAEAEANLLTITATTGDSRLSARVADAYALEFEDFRREADRARFAEGAELLRRQLSDVPVDQPERRMQLGETLQTLTVLAAVTTGDVETVGRADIPQTAASPQPLRDVLLAAVLGAAAGLVGVFLLDLFDRRLKTVEELERAYDLSALTAVPFERSARPADRASTLEHYRILRDSLALLRPDGRASVVLVTSAAAGEGKSTVATGLARAIALGGQHVALVETDLRRPTFAQQFDLVADERGLTTALVDDVPASTLLLHPQVGLSTFQVLPSGPCPPTASELLRSAGMSEVLDELLEVVDIVILDAPPLLPVADAQILLDNPRVDVCLVVARPYRTTRDQTRRTQAILARHGERHAGLVVNAVRGGQDEYHYYGPDHGEDDRPARDRERVRA